MKVLIGIAGAMGAGKTTAADIIVKAFTDAGIEASRESFATPIKQMLMIGLGLSSDQVWGGSKNVVDERYGETPRRMMQTLGTEWGRDMIDPDTWVKVAAHRCELLEGAVVFDDVRLPNELEWIKDNGGVVVYLNGREDSAGIAPHISEVSMSSTSGVIPILNNGTEQDLAKKISDALHLPAMVIAVGGGVVC